MYYWDRHVRYVFLMLESGTLLTAPCQPQHPEAPCDPQAPYGQAYGGQAYGGQVYGGPAAVYGGGGMAYGAPAGAPYGVMPAGQYAGGAASPYGHDPRAAQAGKKWN